RLCFAALESFFLGSRCSAGAYRTSPMIVSLHFGLSSAFRPWAGTGGCRAASPAIRLHRPNVAVVQIDRTADVEVTAHEDGPALRGLGAYRRTQIHKIESSTS